MTIDNENIIDNIPAWSIVEGDQILIDGDPIEVKTVEETSDNDEIIVMGYSHETGDSERYSLYAHDTFSIWSM